MKPSIPLLNRPIIWNCFNDTSNFDLLSIYLKKIKIVFYIFPLRKKNIDTKIFLCYPQISVTYGGTNRNRQEKGGMIILPQKQVYSAIPHLLISRASLNYLYSDYIKERS